MNGNVSLGTSDYDIHIIFGNDCPVEDNILAFASVKYIYTDLADIKRSFFRIGFHLHECMVSRYYEYFGYKNIYDFAMANFNLSKSSVSRFINVYLAFCSLHDNGTRTMFLDEKYKDFSYSQLVEMLAIAPNKRYLIKPDMTIAEIREMKQTMKNVAISQQSESDSDMYIGYDFYMYRFQKCI